MKWKMLVFWLILFGGLYFFFQSYAIFSYQRQEEVQLFIPEWPIIWDMLLVPGGFCSVMGQAIVQFYPNLLFAVWIHSFLLCAIGFLFFLILNKILPHGYNLLLTLIPVLTLMKIHLHPSYCMDGTVGIFLLLSGLCAFVYIWKTHIWVLYSLFSTVLFYLLAGQLVSLYGILLVLLAFLGRKEKRYLAIPSGLLGIVLTYIGMCLTLYIPLTDGLYSMQYQEMQLQPDSFIYYIWIRFTILLLALWVGAFLLSLLPWMKRWQKIGTTGSILLLVIVFAGFCLPDAQDAENRMLDQLSYWEREQRWDMLVRMHQGRAITHDINLSYLNLALAERGELGDKLFYFDQKGPDGLLVPWNHTYYMSALLSDIHFRIGDISIAESYAMDGLTLAKRGGSPRMLQRLVQISLIRKEYKVAEKYLNLLARMPLYRAWADHYKGFICQSEKMKEDKELSRKRFPVMEKDNLLCLMATDSLWKMQLEKPVRNRIAWEYIGCSYLLAKEMVKFKAFLSQYGNQLDGQSLPLHFQEAALVVGVEDISVTEIVKVQPEIQQRYQQFQRDMQQAKAAPNGMAMLYQQYGNTFWFYYYCKQLS